MMSSQENSSSSSSNSSSQNSDHLPIAPAPYSGYNWENQNVCLKVLENMNLAKLSILDSPRGSPIRSPLTCKANLGRSLLRRRVTTTPEKVTPKSMKRKCESSLDCGEGTPKSSKDPRMSISPVKRSPPLRAKRIESPKSSRAFEGNKSKGIAFTRQKITHEFDMAEGMADGVSETMADLFTKPIKTSPGAAATAVSDEGYPNSSEFVDENKENNENSLSNRRQEIPKRHGSVLDDEGLGGREPKRARPSLELRATQSPKSVSWREDREFSFSIPISPKDSSDKLSQSFRGQCNETSDNVKIAVERIGSDSSLIGDGSKKYLLPVLPEEERKHQDLREISRGTLVNLLNGKFKKTVDSFEIVDCRYPYEYHGGHIKSAVNLYTEKMIYEKFVKYLTEFEKERLKEQRHIVIFHCEFSSRRGPSLCRYLRRTDRTVNEYPSLYYPELYVLNGGYKDFFEKHASRCEPMTYLPMVHSNYNDQYRFYKAQSKTDVVDAKSSKQKIPPPKVKSFRQGSMKKLNLDEDEA